MLLFKQCWEVNSLVLTFLEVGFGGNLVQGFKVYAWRAAPSFPKIALCFPSFALRPQPFKACRTRIMRDSKNWSLNSKDSIMSERLVLSCCGWNSTHVLWVTHQRWMIKVFFIFYNPSLDKAPRPSISNGSCALILLVSSTNYFQIVRRQCLLRIKVLSQDI